jgi:hypothetical protein
METETIQNLTIVHVFDPKVQPNRERKALVGFQGFNCDVRLSLGGQQFRCLDHKISCYLIHTSMHATDLLITPKEGVTNWYVELTWTTKAQPIAPVMDEDVQQILTYPIYSMGMIGTPVNTDKIVAKNTIRKIIQEMSLTHFLQDTSQESIVLDILEEYYRSIKLY